jgi:GNAT superfamily N-acetyltransferase
MSLRSLIAGYLPAPRHHREWLLDQDSRRVPLQIVSSLTEGDRLRLRLRVWWPPAPELEMVRDESDPMAAVLCRLSVSRRYLRRGLRSVLLMRAEALAWRAGVRRITVAPELYEAMHRDRQGRGFFHHNGYRRGPDGAVSKALHQPESG